MHPEMTPQRALRAGQLGYIYFNPGMKRSQEAKVGDTYTTVGSEKLVEPLPGFEEPKSMVFVAAYPVDQSDYAHLEDSINQIVLNDRSVTVQKESSEALGLGWRLGFLGTLHCSVFEDRLRQEHGATIIITPPTVPFKVLWANGKEEIIQNPALFPDGDIVRARVAELQEPYVAVTLTLPEEYLGKVIELCEGNRGEQKELQFFTATQVILKYDLPLAQLVDDFFGKLKGATKGYASLDYEEAEWRRSNIVKLQMLVNKVPVDAVSRVVHTSQTERLGRQWVTKFKEHIDRQMFEVVIQATAGKRIVARETLKPFRKDVLQKLHASDVSRRRKLLEKQKEGRKKLQGKFGIQRIIQPWLTAWFQQLLETSRLTTRLSKASLRSRCDNGHPHCVQAMLQPFHLIAVTCTLRLLCIILNAKKSIQSSIRNMEASPLRTPVMYSEHA